jgi:hypothetical protein
MEKLNLKKVAGRILGEQVEIVDYYLMEKL